VLIELAGVATPAAYHLLTQLVVPRPIAWVVSDNGSDDASRWNLAPFSYFNLVAADPPTVIVSIGRSARQAIDPPGKKDTLANLAARPQHTIALPGWSQLEAVEGTSAEVPFGTSEFALADLEPVGWDWSVPMPSGVRAALGCTVERIVPIGEAGQHLVMSRIERVWVDDAVVDEDAKGRLRIEPEQLDPLLRLGGGSYGRIGTTARPLRDARPTT